MESKNCSMCNMEKHINNFYKKKYSDCKDFNRARGLERYFVNKDEIWKQQKIYYEKNIYKIQKQNIRCVHFRNLFISYVESENRLKALEEKVIIIDSEKH